MRLIQLQAENVCNLHAINIQTGDAPGVVEITGPNGAGKSSVLNAVWMLLGGKDAIPAVPIRKGQESARIVGDFGEIVVTREFRLKDDGAYDGDYTTKITVESKDGAKYGSPQQMLEGLISRRSFDPMVFDRLKPAERLEALRKFVVGFDFERNASLLKGAFDERTGISRDLKAARATRDAVVVPPGAPEKPVDEQALVDALSLVGEQAALVERERQRREAQRARADKMLNDVQEKRRQAQRLVEEADAMAKEALSLIDAVEAAAPIQEAPSPNAIRDQLAAARAANAAHAVRVRRAELDAKVSGLEEAEKRLTDRLEELRQERSAAVMGAKFPIDGLSMDEEGVLLNGVPYDQANSAERIRASFALAIADNPKIRVARITDGSRLDADSFRLVQEMAEWADYQVFVETVDQRGASAVHIQEGRQIQ